VTRLVLVSATAGIDDQAERLAADEQLAGEIEQGTIEQFIERWRTSPLFAGDPARVHEEIASDTRRLAPAQLAATLRALGPGRLAPLWDRLARRRARPTLCRDRRKACRRAPARRVRDRAWRRPSPGARSA
jgi:hypothetical protein